MKDIQHSFQFFKYHAFQGYTQGNFPFIFYGDKKAPRKILITKYLRNIGYIKSNVNDYCNKEGTRSYHNFAIEEVYAHQLILCVPINDQVNYTTIRCLYGNKILSI